MKVLSFINIFSRFNWILKFSLYLLHTHLVLIWARSGIFCQRNQIGVRKNYILFIFYAMYVVIYELLEGNHICFIIT